MTEMKIPQAAYNAAIQAYQDSWGESLPACIDAATPLAFAAELRRIAATWGSKDEPAVMNVPPSYVHRSLQRRADELDPEGLTA